MAFDFFPPNREVVKQETNWPQYQKAKEMVSIGASRSVSFTNTTAAENVTMGTVPAGKLWFITDIYIAFSILEIGTANKNSFGHAAIQLNGTNARSFACSGHAQTHSSTINITALGGGHIPLAFPIKLTAAQTIKSQSSASEGTNGSMIALADLAFSGWEENA